jgi:5-methyltetrahydrofolate--homocysteine methyltransferase
VYNLGIKQPIDAIITAYQKHQADAIGLSGLLVKSTLVMKEDLQTLNERGLTPPVILGGAALTRKYVEEDLRAIYKGPLYYGEDAFEGLRIMDEIVARKKLTKVGSVMVRRVAETVQTSHRGALRSQSDTTDGEGPLLRL